MKRIKILICTIAVFCSMGNYEAIAEVERAQEFIEGNSGWLLVDGKFFEGTIPIQSEGAQIRIGEYVFSRGEGRARWSEFGKNSEGGEFVETDIWLAAAERTWHEIQSGNEDVEAIENSVEEWANNHLNENGYPSVSVKIEPEDSMMTFTRENESVPSYCKIEPRTSNKMVVSHKLLIADVSRLLRQGFGIVWGEEYFITYNPEKAILAREVLQEVIDSKVQFEADDFSEYGFYEVRGLKILNAIIFDICAKGEAQ